MSQRVSARVERVVPLSHELTGLIGIMTIRYALYGHILSWVFQVGIGHKIFEGRSPALLDSWQQAFVLAPFFVWLEVSLSV